MRPRFPALATSEHLLFPGSCSPAEPRHVRAGEGGERGLSTHVCIPSTRCLCHTSLPHFPCTHAGTWVTPPHVSSSCILSLSPRCTCVPTSVCPQSSHPSLCTVVCSSPGALTPSSGRCSFIPPSVGVTHLLPCAGAGTELAPGTVLG